MYCKSTHTCRCRRLVNWIAELGRHQIEIRAASRLRESLKDDQMTSQQNSYCIYNDDTGIKDEELKSSGIKSEPVSICDSGISTASSLPAPVTPMFIVSESKSTCMTSECVAGQISVGSELESKEKSIQLKEGLEQKSLLQQHTNTSDFKCDPSHDTSAPSLPLKGHNTSHNDTDVPSSDSGDSGARSSRRRSIWSEIRKPIDKDCLRDELTSLSSIANSSLPALHTSSITQSSTDDGRYHSNTYNHGNNCSHDNGGVRESVL